MTFKSNTAIKYENFAKVININDLEQRDKSRESLMDEYYESVRKSEYERSGPTPLNLISFLQD